MVFSFDSTIRYSEVDSKCVLTLEALTNYFQDCSVFQSEALNIGMDYLKHENMAWVLASWQICIDRLPRLDEKVTISTWAYDMKVSQSAPHGTNIDFSFTASASDLTLVTPS